MAVDLSKVMDLADGLEIYKDLRDRIANIPVPEVPVVGLLINNLRMPINENKYIKFGVQNGVQLTMDEVGGNTVFNLEADLRDVQINGTTIRSQGIANIPTMSTNNFGVAKLGMKYNTGITINASGELKISPANITNIQSSPNLIQPLVSYFVPDIAFFGLAKAAGDTTQSQASTTAHTYTDEAKQAIQKMLGLDGILGDFESTAVASKAYAIGDTFVYNGKRYRATAAIAISDVIAPGTNCVLDPIDGRYVRNTDKATSNNFGVIKVGNGLAVNNNGTLRVRFAVENEIKAGNILTYSISTGLQHYATFYGLAKAAGDTTQSQSVNAVGTYTQEAKAAIRSMIDAVGKTDYATANTAGLVKPGSGIALEANTGKIYMDNASDAQIKSGAATNIAIPPFRQHTAAFYGLAKAAGADMASSSNAVGTYTDAAKTAIQTMLGIEANIPLVETVTGATASITGMPNVRYICDTAISELTITPPASGSIVVRFTAGSNCIVSLPQTVKLPEWFDISSLEAGTTYEIIITDGVYGGVMSWAD